MIYGCASWGFRETPLEKQLAITRELGLDILELGIAGHQNDFFQLDADDGKIRQVRRMFADHGIQLVCASTGNDFTQADKLDCLKSLAQVKKVIDIAAKLEIKYLRVFAGFNPEKDVVGNRWDTMVECLNESVVYAARKNITLGIETHGGVEAVTGGIRHFYSTSSRPELLLKMLEQLDHRAGIVFDPANLGAVGLKETAIIELYNQLKNRIAYMHLKDFRRVSDIAIEPCACGEGQLDWQRLAREFSAFAGPGVIEYELTADIVEGLQRSLKNLRG